MRVTEPVVAKSVNLKFPRLLIDLRPGILHYLGPALDFALQVALTFVMLIAIFLWPALATWLPRLLVK